ncbi:n-terminal fungal transcription regulatory domain-containing protein [Fusarium pseudoanthophilum]|uniref:N-terminal fungal transcription regulatory domain-containing protein n=1 Tax=Fusarium pseudoanthophilum TaxID=48495 RepID=A0A8H5PL53_9HYPO|nr:n-terminal fungal transcription regulatory domain-containing protein [Fusarium pseudoanthophilum]
MVHQKSRPLRRLLPSASSASSRQLAPQAPPFLTSSAPLPKSRPSVPVACQDCRKAKVKASCSGDRPFCHRCERLGLTCEYAAAPGGTALKALKNDYDALQAREASQSKLVDLLTSLPESEAQHVLSRMRSGTPAETILNQVMAADALVQLAVAPETRLRYKLLYKTNMPQELLHNNPYLDTLIYEGASLYSQDNISSPSESSRVHDADTSNQRNTHSTAYLMPFHAAHVVDPLLSNAKPSLWTSVCKDDTLMRDLLGVWLHCEYSFTSAFQKDYFLQDMIGLRKDFCSELLVNAVLAYCCICYTPLPDRAEYWNPKTLTYRFMAEAKRLWELEALEPRITTVHAGIIFNVFHNLSGLDEIGQVYRISSVSMANQLNLFDTPIPGSSERTRKGNVFTAWAVYSWDALVSFALQQAPLLIKPPVESLPDPEADSQWYGEIWVKYPQNAHLTPSLFGHLFKAKSEMRNIMQRFCTMSYTRGTRVRVKEAYELYTQLKEWQAALPDCLQPKGIVFPAQLQLHHYLQHLILAIMKPLDNTEIGMVLDQEPNVKDIIAEAVRNVQTIMRLYYIRHGFETMDSFIVVPLISIGFRCLDRIDDQTPHADLELMRSTLMLVVYGLYQQHRNHYLSKALYRVVRARMRPQELDLVKEALELEEEDADQLVLQQAVRSHWPRPRLEAVRVQLHHVGVKLFSCPGFSGRVYWGSSFSRGNVIYAAAIDKRIKATIIQCPAVSGEVRSLAFENRISTLLEDRRQITSGLDPPTIPLIAAGRESPDPATRNAMFPTKDAYDLLSL